MDVGEELVAGEGFLEEVGREVGAGVVEDFVASEAGHEEYGEVGVALVEALGDVDAGHDGHDDVGEEEVEVGKLVGGEAQGVVSGLDVDDVVSGGLEKTSGDGTDDVLVFDEQDKIGRASCRERG